MQATVCRYFKSLGRMIMWGYGAGMHPITYVSQEICFKEMENVEGRVR